MFYFEKFIAYQKARDIHNEVIQLLDNNALINKCIVDQLSRASLSIVINIAEGTGKNSKKDKINFYIIARGSIYECVAIFQIMKDQKIISDEKYKSFYNQFEEITKILTTMIKNLG